ncbi:sugar transport protein 1-like [Henckelia pumila]|uniref:sugar transport protein 1-like n=1 Tax=Henckelia pumila TaxID=405737 RepID=UPI003C6DB956
MDDPVIVTARKKAYPGRLTCYFLFICVIAATAGLMFGYVIGMSGGWTTMPSLLKKFFPDEYKQQQVNQNVGVTNQYCKFNAAMSVQFSACSLFLAASGASVAASLVTRFFGRRISMIIAACLCLFGAATLQFSGDASDLKSNRAIFGLGIGIASQSAPLYLSEMAPCQHRGALNICFQLCITLGIVASYAVNYIAEPALEYGWQISAMAAMIPAMIFLSSYILPETPISLIERGKQEDARKILRMIRGIDDVDEELDDLVAASVESRRIKCHWIHLLERKHRPQLVFVLLIPLFQQLTGINAFMFYSHVLFRIIGFGNRASLMCSIIIGSVNSAATILSIIAADKVGRKTMFIVGGVQMFICQIAITILIASKFGVNGNPGDLPKWYTIMVVITICIYIAGFAWSWGPLAWLVTSEILPLEIRSEGQSVNVCVNMFWTFLVGQTFTHMLCHLKFGLFIVLACFVLLMTILVLQNFPETKGIPIEEMADIWKSHPYWKKFVEDVDKEAISVENKVLDYLKRFVESRFSRLSRLIEGENDLPPDSSSEANPDVVTNYKRSKIGNWILGK